MAVTNVALKIDDTVKDTQGSIEKMIPNYMELMYNVKRDLVDTLTEKSTATVETQTSRRKY